tara:strand:- start:396 stop:1118 length:723 start_codon:yes stop_codon:yes gene_type:complete
MSDYELLIKYLADNLDGMSLASGSGLVFDFPDFELMPFDYLEFAEQELSQGSVSSRIGCVSNLKRATECEMDTLLHILGIAKHAKNFPQKLDFVSKAGLVSPRSLDKLNKIRNKMEHQYAVPELREIEAYLDLASGFVHAIEGYIFMLVSYAEQQWSLQGSYGKIALDIELSRGPAQIKFDISLPAGEEKTLLFKAEEFDSYLSALRVFFLLCRATTLLSAKYVVSKITKRPSAIISGRS